MNGVSSVVIADRFREAVVISAIKEVADRMDGRPPQAIERGDIPLEAMTDQQLMAIIRGASSAQISEPLAICAPATE